VSVTAYHSLYGSEDVNLSASVPSSLSCSIVIVYRPDRQYESAATAHRQVTVPCGTIRGELALWRASSRHNLVSGRSIRIRTMMQLCASAAKLRGGGPNLRFGFGSQE
jgi:hypothetical protein